MRKSGDGSPSASDRPGSYVKVSGTRRRRKGKRGGSIPPTSASDVASDVVDTPRIVDTVGEEEESSERISDLGVVVDDLRRASKPSSSRAPRRELGPLGVEDIRSDPPANTFEREPSGPPGRGSQRVIEVQASIEARELDGRSPFDDDEPSDHDAGFDDDPFASEALALRYELDETTAPERRRPSSEALAQSHSSLIPARDGYPRDADDPRNSMSSVLGARPSFRPSPSPPRETDNASVLWWVMVSAFAAIIAAAGVIAWRERFQEPQATAEPPAPEAPVAPEPAEMPKPPPVSFGLPQIMQGQEMPAADRLKPTTAPVGNSGPALREAAPAAAPSARSEAPATSAPTKVAPRAAAPSVSAPEKSASEKSARAAAPSERGERAAEAAAPSAPERAEEAPAGYAPGYGKQLAPGTPYAPGYAPGEAAPSRARPAKPALDPMRKTELKPVPETAREPQVLPINPYE